MPARLHLVPQARVAVATVDAQRQHELICHRFYDVNKRILFEKQFDVIPLTFQTMSLVAGEKAVDFVLDELHDGVPSFKFILPADACRVIQCSERDMAQVESSLADIRHTIDMRGSDIPLAAFALLVGIFHSPVTKYVRKIR